MFLVRTLLGLEPIVADELRERFGVRNVDVGHREVRFRARLTPALVDLGTADDVFLVVHDGPALGHHRAELERLSFAGQIDLAAMASSLEPIRSVEDRTFDVSASFLGRRNYSRYEIEDAVGYAVESETGWRYQSRQQHEKPSGSLSLRVHLTSERATVAVRLASQPLHRRLYRVASRPGALHPPLARALARLAAPAGGGVLLDPFCGTGTVPIEAKLGQRSVHAVGSDVDRSAITAARRNADAAGARVDFVGLDAGRLPFPDGAVDAVATNPPWGLRVRAAGALAADFDRFWVELERLLRPGALAALLSPQDTATESWGSGISLVQRFPIRVSGALADVIVLARDT